MEKTTKEITDADLRKAISAEIEELIKEEREKILNRALKRLKDKVQR